MTSFAIYNSTDAADQSEILQTQSATQSVLSIHTHVLLHSYSSRSVRTITEPLSHSICRLQRLQLILTTAPKKMITAGHFQYITADDFPNYFHIVDASQETVL